jgi:hypothetical protein
MKGSFLGNLVDCPLDSAYCVMFDSGRISYLLRPGDSVAPPDYTTGSRQCYGLAVHQIDVSALVKIVPPNHQIVAVICPIEFFD